MGKCMKKTAERNVPLAVSLADETVGRCGRSAHVVDIDTAITVLLCDQHHVELQEAAMGIRRALRRSKMQLTAVVAGYSAPDVEMSDIADALDSVEMVEDDLAEFVRDWMEKEPVK